MQDLSIKKFIDSSTLSLFLMFCICLTSSVQGQSIFETRTAEALKKDSLKIIDSLLPVKAEAKNGERNLSESQKQIETQNQFSETDSVTKGLRKVKQKKTRGKTAPKQEVQNQEVKDKEEQKQLKAETQDTEEVPKELRFHQYLILKHKKAKQEIEIDFAKEYLDKTRNCLTEPASCLEDQSTYSEYISSIYTQFDEQVLKDLKQALEKQTDNNFARNKFINLSLNLLNQGIHEVDGPNNDSITGGNKIKEFFQAAGIKDVETEMTSDKTDEWAWCAALITSLYNQIGQGFSFIQQKEYLNACRDMDKKAHCHPIQVDFILNWSKRKAKVNLISNLDIANIESGDLLVLMNEKKTQANHIGIFIAADSATCQENNFTDCWVYTLEGNAGPFINDALENDWPQLKNLIKKQQVSQTDYERLLDRLTLVKRPLKNWEYQINLFE